MKYGLVTAGVLFCSCCLLLSTTAFAEEGAEEPEVAAESGRFVHNSALQIRVTPLGLSLFSTTGYRIPLWDDPESDLFSNTQLQLGAATALSPAFVWAGPYVAFTPLAVLPMRASFQVMNYFGNFGYLYVPDDGDWSLDALDRSDDQGLGVSAWGRLIHLQATPQIRVNRFVVTAETNAYWIDMDVEDDYYEPYFDLLFEPSDFFFITRPTVGYLIGQDLSVWYLLLGLRWERAMVRGTEVVRDTAGVVFNWKPPATLVSWGDPSLAGFVGAFLDHPNRGEVSPYLGIQAMFAF